MKLARFFTHLFGEWKSAAISKFELFLTEWSRSYFIFALIVICKGLNWSLGGNLHHLVEEIKSKSCSEGNARPLEVSSCSNKLWANEHNIILSVFTPSCFRESANGHMTSIDLSWKTAVCYSFSRRIQIFDNSILCIKLWTPYVFKRLLYHRSI